MAEIDPQEFGRLQAQVQQLLDADKEKSQLLTELAEDMRAVRLQLAEARGGWRLLLALGGMAGSAGALITWAATYLRFK